MKKKLLTSDKQYYKANLHSHSTVSDGKYTPEEMKKNYMEHGYSIIAYTDHNILIGHNDLTDDNFLALNGFEVNFDSEEPEQGPLKKTCHICLVALDKDNLTQICYNRNKFFICVNPKYKGQEVFDETKPDFERKYTPECINEVIKTGVENGFFVTYNHPTWSMESFEYYGKYHGMHAMEICNYSSLEQGFDEYNEHEYDDMVKNGEKIYCIATDDNHNIREDSYGGFTVINAEKLDYPTIADALLKGDFYASQGPEIYNLWYEDGKIGIESSKAKSIRINSSMRRSEIVYAEDREHPVTSAVFELHELDEYVRITVTDFDGKHANTNAYFVEDLNK